MILIEIFIATQSLLVTELNFSYEHLHRLLASTRQVFKVEEFSEKISFNFVVVSVSDFKSQISVTLFNITFLHQNDD